MMIISFRSRKNISYRTKSLLLHEAKIVTVDPSREYGFKVRYKGQSAPDEWITLFIVKI